MGLVESDKKTSMKYRAVGGLVLQQVAAAGQVLLQVVTLAILARLLAPQDFGVFSIASVFASFTELIAQLGVGPALVQREKLSDAHVSTAFTLSLIVGLILASFLWVSAPVVATYYEESVLNNVLRVVSLTFLISSAATVSLSMLQRRLEFRRYVTVNLVSYALGYCLVSVVLAMMGYGIWALVGGTLAQAVLKLALSLVLSPHRLSMGISLPIVKDLMSFGGGFTLARIFNYLATQGDYLVLGRIGGANVLGVYSRAYQLMAMPASQIGSVLERVLFPVWARSQADILSLSRSFLAASGGLSLVTMAVSAILVVTAPEVIGVVLGTQWHEVIVPFQIMTLTLFARTGYKLSDSLAKATGAVYSRAVRELLYAVMVVVGTWIGYHWGIRGASIGVSLAILLNWVLGLTLSRRILGLSRRDIGRVYLKPIVFGLITSLVTWLVRRGVAELFPSSSVMVLVTTVLTSLTFVTAMSLAAPSILGREMLLFLLTLLDMVKSRKRLDWVRKRIESGITETKKCFEGEIV